MEEPVIQARMIPEQDAPKNIQGKEQDTMDGINSDKVNIHVGGGSEGAGGGAGLAAVNQK